MVSPCTWAVARSAVLIFFRSVSNSCSFNFDKGMGIGLTVDLSVFGVINAISSIFGFVVVSLTIQ